MQVNNQTSAPGPASVLKHEHTPRERGTGFDHIQGLDGLRAFSVIAVLLYHAHFGWASGGFLGVEVFFVISGFLITGLLLKEHARQGRIQIGQFLLRRARRLLPALFALLLCVTVYGWLFLGPESSQFRPDLVTSLFYVENWYQIFSGSSYFADQGLPLLRHLWSLAVEEQFYFAWPILVAACLAFRKTRTWTLLGVTAVLAGASCLLAYRLADPFNASAMLASESLNRVYLGTDTRALGLLLGALLAMVLALRPASPRTRRWAGAAVDLAAFLALAGLGTIMATLDIQAPWLYRGGFLGVDVLTLILLFSLVSASASWMRVLLRWAPLEWVGKRSYGLYLWHWPVFRLLRPDQGGVLAPVLCLLVTLALTEASYRWIELPIRSQGFLKWLRTSSDTPTWRLWVFRGATLLLVGISTVGGLALANRPHYVDPVAAAIRAGAAALDKPVNRLDPPLALEPVPQTALNPVMQQAAPLPLAGVPPLAPVPSVIPMPEELKGASVTAIGDSVMKGAAVALKRLGESSLGKGKIVVDAEECRSFSHALPVLRAYKAEGRLGDLVVIHLGTNNSSVSEEQFAHLMKFLADRRLVLFLTAKSDKLPACEKVNQNLRALVPGYPNARLLDWKGAMDLHPECFYSDVTHLRTGGSEQYANLILANVAESVPNPGLPSLNRFVAPIPLTIKAP